MLPIQIPEPRFANSFILATLFTRLIFPFPIENFRKSVVVVSFRFRRTSFRRRRCTLFGLLLLAFALLGPSLLHAQSTRSNTESDTARRSLDRPVRVFLDCRQCYESYMRRNINFVDYVRDRKQADVHVLGTRRRTGGGGVSYRLRFVGQGPLEGLRHELTYEASPSRTREERRRGLAERLRLGLAPFASRSSTSDYLDITYSPPEEESDDASTDEDPWNRWVFDVGVSGSADLQSQEYAYELEGDLSAERVTEAWKHNVRMNGEREVDVFEREDTTDIRSTSEDYDVDAAVVKTLGPNSGIGLSSTVFSRTFTNIQLGTRIRAAFEYNLFPYDISDQKQLTFRYRIGPEYRNYRSITIFEQRRETLAQQSAQVGLRLNQTWGSVFSQLEVSNYFHDLSKNSVEFRGFLSVRLIEGLSLRLRLNAERIQDQLSLPAGDPSDEEVLLRRRERATTYELGGSIGISYTFGSIYNNVVNTRL